MLTITPHDYQSAVIPKLRDSIKRDHKHIVVQSATGTGKTVIAALLIYHALRKGNRTLFIVDRIDLVNQTISSFQKLGLKNIGAIQSNHEMTNPSALTQVASIQTLSRMKERHMPMCNLVIIDEVHDYYEAYTKLMESWNNLIFIGLSATPWSKGLGCHFTDLIVLITTTEGIRRGILSDFVVYAPSQPDLSECKTSKGDYTEKSLSPVMSDNTLIADIVNSWKLLGNNENTLCFCVDRAHAKKVQDQFNRAGVPTGYIDCFVKSDERKEIENKLHSGELRIVVNVGCLTKGIDWDIRCIILARPTKSEMLYCQIIGRGLRSAEGKKSCIILDHTNTTLNLGFVTDINHTHLDDGERKKRENKKEKKSKLPTICTSCDFLKPKGVHKCPSCGFAPVIQSPIETEEGFLIEIKGKKYTHDDCQRWYSMLLYHAEKKGYSEGWAAHKYKEKLSQWPNGLQKTIREPDQEVLNYIKYLNIRKARSKR